MPARSSFSLLYHRASPSLLSCQHDEGVPAVPNWAGQKAQNPTQGKGLLFSYKRRYLLAPKYASSHIFFFSYSISLLQDSRKRVKLEKKEPLVESQIFIMELARELNKICQVCPSPPSSLSNADKPTSKLYLTFVVCNLEVKRPQPHLDRRGCMAGQRVPWFHHGMVCRVGEKSSGIYRVFVTNN